LSGAWPKGARRWRWRRCCRGRLATAATAIIAELGTDMSRLASDKHLDTSAGVCPGNKQSGGKRLSGKTTHGNPYLRAVLGEVAWAVSHTKDHYVSAQFHRIALQRGKQRRWWRSRIASWSSCTPCCAKANPTANWARIPLRNWRLPGEIGLCRCLSREPTPLTRPLLVWAQAPLPAVDPATA
jgi:hypothetical protein